MVRAGLLRATCVHKLCAKSMNMKSRLTWFVIIAMITGPLFGLLLHEVLGTGPAADSAAAGFSLVTSSFLRLIKMIIAPLVFCTLVVGVARMEGAAAIARIGAKALGWFVVATLDFHDHRPGGGAAVQARVWASRPRQWPAAQPARNRRCMFKDFLEHIIPSSVVQAMANNEILQIVVFSVFFGAAASSLGQGQGPDRHHRRDRRRHLAGDPLRHGFGAAGDLRRARRHRLDPGPECARGVCEVHRQLLSCAGASLDLFRRGSCIPVWAGERCRCCRRSARRCCWRSRPPVPKRRIRKPWSAWNPSA